MKEMSDEWCRDIANACARHLTKAEVARVLRVAMEHPDRFLRMYRATLAGTQIGGSSREEAEERLARAWLRVADEAMSIAPGGSS